MDLKGKQFQSFQEAMLSAYPQYSNLQRMVRFELNESLPGIVAPGAMQQVMFDLISWAEAEGRLEELLAGAVAQNATNRRLRQLAMELALTSDAPPKPQGRFEALVLQNVAFQNVVQWRNRMADVERCVCRVEIPTGRGIGTGFLVGPSVVLTNWHLADIARQQSIAPSNIAVRFDYVTDVAGSGQACALDADWLLDDSPVQELDYALLHVAGEPGKAALSDQVGKPRGWLKMVAHNFTPGEPIFILQHPQATSLKLSVGAVTAMNGLFNRVTYTANTEPGSSGSPCFTLDWEPVALHHYGEQTGNMGIPLAAIAQRLQEKNMAAALQ